MLGEKKRKLPSLLLISLLIIILSLSSVGIAYSSTLEVRPGQVLQYKYSRFSTSDQSQQVGDALYQILSFNEKTLSFQISSGAQFSYSISYENGFPVSIDRLEALVYLPPQSVSQSMQGDLNWTTQIQTNKQQNVVSGKGEVLDFTVEAGSYQCVNITLGIAAPWDSGNLTLLYDVDSGILVYTQWIPAYGDIIIQFLASTDFVLAPQGTIVIVLSAALSLLAFGMPIFLVVHQMRKRRKTSPSPTSEVQASNVMRSGFPKIAFIVALVGASLSLASILLPWSQTRNIPTYLPLSISSIFNPSAGLLTLNLNFTLFNMALYGVIFLSWIAIAFYLNKTRKLTPQIAAFASSIIAFASIAFFTLSGWTYSWGIWVAVAGSVLTLISLAIANIRITIEIEPDVTEEKDSASEENEFPQ